MQRDSLSLWNRCFFVCLGFLCYRLFCLSMLFFLQKQIQDMFWRRCRCQRGRKECCFFGTRWLSCYLRRILFEIDYLALPRRSLHLLWQPDSRQICRSRLMVLEELGDHLTLRMKIFRKAQKAHCILSLVSLQLSSFFQGALLQVHSYYFTSLLLIYTYSK